MSPTPRHLSAGWWFAVLVVSLFALGFFGWLVQGAGDDETVPTVTDPSLPALLVTTTSA